MPTQAGPRMTLATQLVLRALLDEPSQERYGLQISAATGLPSGTVHPILARLDGRDGWRHGGNRKTRASKGGRGGATTGSPQTAPGTRGGRSMRPAPWSPAPGPPVPARRAPTARVTVAAY